MKFAILAAGVKPKEMSFEEATAKVNEWINILNAESDEATIEIDGFIGDDFWGEGTNTVKAVKNKLKEISALKAKKIIVNINSLGGSVSHGLGIHDVLAQHKAEIETNVNGLTASSATVIAQAGDTRRMSDNALYLIHQPWGLFISNVSELEQNLEDMKAINNRLVKIYSKRSGESEDGIRALMDESNGNGKWIDGDEALDMGLIDEVFEPMEAAAMVLPEGIEAHVHLPELPKAKDTGGGASDEPEQEQSHNQIIEIMNKKLTEGFDALKAWFNEKFKKEDSDESQIPEEAQKKLDELEAEIKEVGTQEDRVTELEGEVETITGERDTANTSLETANGEISTLKTQLAQAKANSTLVPGKEGMEGVDGMDDEQQRALASDVAKIKAEFA